LFFNFVLPRCCSTVFFRLAQEIDMPLTFNVEVSRKLGLPNYGSAGARCSLYVDLDPLVVRDAAVLQSRIHEAFDVCREAVDGELAAGHNGQAIACLPAPQEAPADPEGICVSDARAALITSRQLDFLDHLARQIRPLGGQRLKLLAEHLYARPLAELTSAEGSKLIDLLKDLRAGTRNIDELLPQTAV
jgi:hypothetical protein